MIAYQPANRRRTILALTVLTAVALITLDVRGAGFFEAHDGPAGSPSLDALRAAIETRHGGAWATRRRAEAELALRSLPLDPIETEAVDDQ